jgi:hypothetical protein
MRRPRKLLDKEEIVAMRNAGNREGKSNDRHFDSEQW